MRYRLAEIPGGLAGTERTVKEIVRLVERDLRRPELRLIASRILQSAGTAHKDHRAEAEALYSWVKHEVRYQRDPIGIESVQSPLVTYKLRFGDCDDQVALLAGLAMAVGLPVRFRVLGHSLDNLVHIFTEVFDGQRWWPADTTELPRRFGWRPPRFPVERIYNMKGDAMIGLSGTLPVTRKAFQTAIGSEVWRTLKENWESGGINEADLDSYLRVIHEGNFPTDQPLIVEPTEQAILAFKDYVRSENIPSYKAPGTLSGLEGLDGFLKSVFKAVKKVAGGVYKFAIGQKQKERQAAIEYHTGITPDTFAQPPAPFISLAPKVTLPPGLITTPVTPAAAAAGVGALFTNPMFLGLAALGLILLLKK